MRSTGLILRAAAFLLFCALNALAGGNPTEAKESPRPTQAEEVGEIPGAPTDLALTIIPSGFRLTWTLSPQDPGSVTGYEIARAAVFSGPYETVGRVDKGIGRFEDTTAAPENIYYYKVRAVAGGAASPYSREAAGELSGKP